VPAEVLALLDGDIALHMTDGVTDVRSEAFAAPRAARGRPGRVRVRPHAPSRPVVARAVRGRRPGGAVPGGDPYV